MKKMTAKERYINYYLKKHPHATWWVAVNRYFHKRELHDGYYDQPEDLDSFRMDYSDRF